MSLEGKRLGCQCHLHSESSESLGPPGSLPTEHMEHVYLFKSSSFSGPNPFLVYLLR